ncbi:hypothetical protein [Malonomonas rubra]|uniref:hypothetical protein n=1 Tax=Malonomonas rubra TaxID=57040 RepID=UPI0026EDD4AC|nr:hypothetical protein [Malonomonas rubra]
MVNRDQSDQKNRLFSRQQETQAEAADLQLEEVSLVALGALHHVDPEIVKNTQLFSN